MSGFDPNIIESLYKDIGNSVNKIIVMYVEDFPNTTNNMRVALEQKEYETIGRLAHSLKSSSGNLGALELVEASIYLEMLIKSGSTDAAEINSAIIKLDQAFGSLEPKLNNFIR